MVSIFLGDLVLKQLRLFSILKSCLTHIWICEICGLSASFYKRTSLLSVPKEVLKDWSNGINLANYEGPHATHYQLVKDKKLAAKEEMIDLKAQ